MATAQTALERIGLADSIKEDIRKTIEDETAVLVDPHTLDAVLATLTRYKGGKLFDTYRNLKTGNRKATNSKER